MKVLKLLVNHDEIYSAGKMEKIGIIIVNKSLACLLFIPSILRRTLYHICNHWVL